MISVIIPIYNSEKYLRKCINSLITQSSKNFEIVLINDGSTDSSETICKEYEKKYNYVRYFAKKNSGVSSARNYGLKKAAGDYITFLDSDDYLDKDFILNTTEIIKNEYEMVIYDHSIVNGDKIEIVSLGGDSRDITYPDCIDKYFDSYCLSTACKIVYNRKMIISNKIFFNEKINYGEDMLFSFEAYVISKKTYYKSYCGYYYLMNNQSASHNDTIEKRIKYCNDNLILYLTIKKILEEKSYKVSEQKFLDALLKNLIYGIDKTTLLNNNDNDKTIRAIINNYKPYLKKTSIYKSKLSIYLKIQVFLLKYNQIKLLKKFLKIKKRIKKL